MLSRLMMDSFTIQSNIEPLYDTLITNIILCANYISVKKKKNALVSKFGTKKDLVSSSKKDFVISFSMS